MRSEEGHTSPLGMVIDHEVHAPHGRKVTGISHHLEDLSASKGSKSTKQVPTRKQHSITVMP